MKIKFTILLLSFCTLLLAQSNKSTRQNFATGGYVEYTTLDDGRTMVKTVIPCNLCHGSKICPSCYGQGGRLGPAYGGTWYPCVLCGGSGINNCRVCAGKGEIITIVYADGNNAYGISSNGSTSHSNSAGTVVTTPYGTKVYANESGSSSSSSRSTCTKCGGRGYESTSYKSAAASTHGWMQPYHNSAGSSCPHCSLSSDHYHYPCTECRGYGHK